jgi:oligopeptide transport system ATP-binding protein
VRGVSFSLGQGEALGIVGESGSGKSVTSMSVLRLLGDNAVVKSGEINYSGKNILLMNKKELRALRGDRISMIFQDPMSSLNPLMRVGTQIAEMIELHNPA